MESQYCSLTEKNETVFYFIEFGILDRDNNEGPPKQALNDMEKQESKQGGFALANSKLSHLLHLQMKHAVCFKKGMRGEAGFLLESDTCGPPALALVPSAFTPALPSIP